MKLIGHPLPRREDHRLLRGEARFIADLRVPDLHDAVAIRSPFARARITAVNTRAAQRADGVVAVLTASDLDGAQNAITRQFYTLTPAFVARHEVDLGRYQEPILAGKRVNRVGEPVAMVIASSREAAEDAAELVDVEYENLVPIVDPFEAMDIDSEPVLADHPNNVQSSFRITIGEPEKEIGLSQRSVGGRFRIARSVGSPIETRGVIAIPPTGAELLTVWSTTQIPHVLRSYLAEFLHYDERAIRVVAPDMGGSFGGGIYPEELLTALAALRLRRPVRWLEDRRENLGNARHSRDQVIDAVLAYDRSGRFRAMKMRIVQDCGSTNPFGLTLPFNVASHARGQFALDHFDVEGLCVLTNKNRVTPVRGAGRPEATFVLDRLVDMAARDLGMDPAGLRMINLIPAEEMPRDMGMLYRDGNPMVYDSGDYPEQLRCALDSFGYKEKRRTAQKPRPDGLLPGIGISAHVEATGLGPHEVARIEIDHDGSVTLTCGSNPHGQSHATTLAQVAGEVLDLPYDRIETRFGDTILLPEGGGTFGSRSAVTAGTAVWKASTRMRDMLKKIAADLLECHPADLVLSGGKVHPKGVPGLALTYRELAGAAQGDSALEETGSKLSAEDRYTPPSVTFGSGTHIASVLVDRETGMVRVTDYLVVDDCGTILNPVVVDGQQHGGVVHGIGNALLEEVHHDREGQLLSGTFLDYLLPTLAETPDITVIHRPHPTPLNPPGIKGAGEGSTASAPGAIANAIVDALRPLPIEINEIPITPHRLLDLIRQAEHYLDSGEPGDRKTSD